MFLDAFELCIGVLIVKLDSLESLFILILPFELAIDSLCFLGDFKLELFDFFELCLMRGISFSHTTILLSLASLTRFLFTGSTAFEPAVQTDDFLRPLFLLAEGWVTLL